jgi:hypothetical protein
MQYRTTRCPHCEFVLEYRSNNAQEWFGPPVALCPNCHQPFKTGRQYFDETSRLYRVAYVISAIPTCIYTGAVYAMFVPLGLFAIELISQWLTGKNKGIVLEHVTEPWFYIPVLAIIAVIVVNMLRLVIRRQIQLTRIARPEGDEIPYWHQLP